MLVDVALCWRPRRGGCFVIALYEMAGEAVAALSIFQGFLLPCRVDDLGIIRDDWLEGKIFVFIFLFGFFVFFSLSHLVLSKPIDDISLKLILLCNHIINLLAGIIDKRLLPIILGLLLVSFYLFLVESISLGVVFSIKPITGNIGFFFAEGLFGELSLEKFFICSFLSILLFLQPFPSLLL